MDDFPARPSAPLKIGISECLAGEEVRYDGSSARSSWPHHALGELFELRPICPEVGIGMTVPREPIRLVGSAESYRVVGVKDASVDKTDELREFGLAQAATFGDLCGYIFMKNSPSCGLYRVKVYPSGQGMPKREGTGAYAAAVTEALPSLPVEECGRLFDDVIRENFVTRIFTYAHWKTIEQELTAKRLIDFHSRYKMLLMAHSVPSYQECGRLLSDLSGDVDAIGRDYIQRLMDGLAKPATRKGHANVLSHLQGYLKKRIDGETRQELERLIQAYRRGEQPLLAPMTLLQHLFRRYPDEYVLNQSYFDPHPSGAGLRRPL